MSYAVPKKARRARSSGSSRSHDGHDGASAYLTAYFRDLSELHVLTAEQELAIAKNIEQLELQFWTVALAHPAALPLIASALSHHAEASGEATALCRMASAPRDSDGNQATIAKLVVSLRQADADRLFVEDVMLALELSVRGSSRSEVPKVVSVQSRRFSDWHHKVRVAHRQAATARADFVRANLRLVVSIARRFNHGRMSLADLIQEGNLGLIKAVERFDYRRGFRFSTYASWWIRHAISRGLADKGREVRLPVHMIDAQHKLNRARRQLTATLGRSPTSEELALETGTDLDKVEKMRGWLLEQSVSIDRPISGGSDTESRTLAEILVDPDGSSSVSETMTEESTCEEVREVLSELRPIEADILRQRFGLDTEKELTLKEIGDKYQLSRERIRQLQEQALAKMRRALERRAG
jgi:RNA polymerase primary sigma factor